MISLLSSDAKLTNLARVIDPQTMAGHFAAGFPATAGVEISRCVIEKIFYRPGHSCTLLYRLLFRNGGEKAGDQWILGKVFPASRAGKRYEEARREVQAYAGADGAAPDRALPDWPPISFLPELNMLLWTFPQDPKLPHLPIIASPALLQREINANLDAFDFDGDWQCEGVRFDRVKYMPGKRCVLRCHAQMRGPDAAARQITFYSKTYNDGKSRYHFEVLRAACAALARRGSRVQIPRLILHLDGVNTFWQEEWQGRPLVEALDDYNWRSLFPHLAGAVADLHNSDLTALRRGPEVDDTLSVALDDAEALFGMLPSLEKPLAPLLARLTEMKSALAQQALPLTPIHGAMRTEQMLARGDELAMVDFDALAFGDPLADIAEFVASLQFLELSQGKSRKRLAEMADLFCASYAGQVSWPFDYRRLAWYALAYWISKMYLACKNLDLQSLQHLEAAGLEIAEGWFARLGLET